MIKCESCSNKPICKVLDYIKNLEPNITLDVTYCKYETLETLKEEAKKVYSNPLDKLGLSNNEQDNKVLPVVEKDITSNIPEGETKYCPSCKELVPLSEFSGKRCLICNQEICEDCAIYSGEDVYCEYCF